MSDFTAPQDKRIRDTGSPSDRKMSTANAVALGSGAGLALGFIDALTACYKTGHYVFVMPDQQFLEMASLSLLLPVGLWVGKVFSLIGQIVINRLQKDEGKP